MSPIELFWTAKNVKTIKNCHKCLKGHKSLGSLCSVVNSLIVSGNRPSKGQTMSPIELFWTAKKKKRMLNRHLSSPAETDTYELMTLVDGFWDG